MGGDPGLFLDRDGTIVVDLAYPREPERVELLAGAAAALRGAKALGYKLVVVSNQSGVGRGLIAKSEMDAVQARVAKLLGDSGVVLDGVYFCVHAPDASCACRKPSPAMILSAAHALGIDLSRSVMVGDKESDVLAGRAAGCATVRYGDGAAGGADLTTTSWPEILSFLSSRGPGKEQG